MSGGGLSELRRVGVVGGGIMGSGIAALFANQGIPVTLFDVSEELARKSLEKLADPAAKHPQLFSPKDVRHIQPASTESYAALLPECDAIVEVVPEVLALKRKVLAAIDAHRRPGSVVSTNTSGLSIDAMVEGLSDDLRAHFLGTHYFHPVRYMPLVELIPGATTRAELIEAYAALLRRLGKKPVVGRDTPNFIANRIGVFAMMRVLARAAEADVPIERADLVTGPLIGNPKTASFRLADMVGLDTLLHVAQNSYDRCPDDEVREQLRPHAWLERLVEAGRFGLKTGAGFYRKEGKAIRVLDPATFEYREQEPSPRPDLAKLARKHPDPADRLRAAFAADAAGDPELSLARAIVLETGAYALNRVGEVADDLLTIDQAMRLGFGREIGPIEALQAIGPERAATLMEEGGIAVPALLRQALAAGGQLYGHDASGRTTFFSASGALVPERDDPAVLSLERLRRRGATVHESPGARLVDLGDGVLLCEPASQKLPALNPIDDHLLDALERAHDEVAAGKFVALVLGSQATNFCAGANLAAVLELARAGKWEAIDALAHRLQRLALRGLHAPYPVVAAPHGLTLGGGLELALGAPVRVVHTELYCGLVEVGVGLVPAGGGCLRLLQLQEARRNLRGGPLGPMQRALAAFDLIGWGKTSSSAKHAKALGLLAKDDVVCPAKDEQLRRAKEVALERLAGWQALPAQPVSLPGRGGYLVMEDTIDGMLRGGKITPHAATIARVQARILTGGDDANPTAGTSEERVCELEREGFLELVKTPETQARMLHMLEKGKPLFN